jgi:hypothetical protein
VKAFLSVASLSAERRAITRQLIRTREEVLASDGGDFVISFRGM